MLMAYSDSTGKNVTLSPRLSHGHVEPSYSKDFKIQVLGGTKIDAGNYTVNAKCSNCRKWKGGFIDPKNVAAKFNYATGPSGSLKSNSLTANTKRHDLYGAFTMDLTKAVGVAGVPVITLADSTGTVQTQDKGDNDFGPRTHAILMILAFVGFMPLAVLILRVLKSPKWHAITQTASAAVAIIGTGLGIKAGMEYNRVSSRQKNSVKSPTNSYPDQKFPIGSSNIRHYHSPRHDRPICVRVHASPNLQADPSHN